METPGRGARRLLSVLDPERLRRVLAVMLDENEFLSPHGVRALSRAHRDRPYVLPVNGTEHRVTVLEKGFEYRDEEYGSLSQVARRITGSRWSGPAFFGLKRRREAKA